MRIRPLLDKAIVGQDIRQYSAVNIGYTDQDGKKTGNPVKCFPVSEYRGWQERAGRTVFISL